MFINTPNSVFFDDFSMQDFPAIMVELSSANFLLMKQDDFIIEISETGDILIHDRNNYTTWQGFLNNRYFDYRLTNVFNAEQLRHVSIDVNFHN